MRLLLGIFLTLLVAPLLIAMVLGWLVAPNFLQPVRRALAPDMVQQADASFGQIGLHREAFDVRAPDGVLLHSSKVRAAHPNRSWVLLFRGVADNRMASDYAGLQKYPWLGKTLFAPGAWVMRARGQALAGFPSADVSPEKAVASRAFPVFLICDQKDKTLPCRHAERIYAAASGPKSLWVVPQAYHTAALGYEPNEFKRRVLHFFADPAATP